MPEPIPSIASKARHALSNASRADLVNGLAVAYCRVVAVEKTVPDIQGPQTLATFAMLAYGQIAGPDGMPK